jgi:ubiquinone/menaquinone biosynthesis C-methylase UbiE
LLAGKGELSLYDVNEGSLDVARRRLVAHGLRAHLHVRDAWDEPDRAVDAVFAGFWLSLLPSDRLEPFLRLAHRWLRPGGVFAFIDRKGDPEAEAVDEPAPEQGVVRRSLPDGRSLLVPQVVRAPDELAGALMAAGFASADVTETARFFVMGVARR